MEKRDFTFGYSDSPLEDAAGNIVIAGDPPHVVIPIQPIPSIRIVARNLHWHDLGGVLKITVNGVEREFHYDFGHGNHNSTVTTDLGTIYMTENYGSLVWLDIGFKAFTIDKSSRSCQLSVSIEPGCMPYDTHPVQWEVSLFGAGIHESGTEDVYACIGSNFHLLDMQIDTQSRTGWIEIHKGVDPDKTCESCGGGDEPEPPPPPPNLPETVYVTGNWRVTTTHDGEIIEDEEGQVTPYSALLTMLENGDYLYEGTRNPDDAVYGDTNYGDNNDGKILWTVASGDVVHPEIDRPFAEKEGGGPEGVYTRSYTADIGEGYAVSVFIQFTVSALGVDEMFE
jgi:hypothetical protein